jgi:helicase
MGVEELVLSGNGFSCFNELQLRVLQRNWADCNMVVSAPTSSGKTVVAELFALNSVINKGRKVVYTCPLRALAFEHYSDFKRKYSHLGLRVTISTGDFDSSSVHLMDYDVIFTTYEKLFSLLNHRAQWLSSVGVLVVDEVHEIDSSRGPVIEVVVTKLGTVCSGLQLLALSATIPNAGEIAQWLNAELVESDFRPVKLEKGVFFDNKLFFSERTEVLEGSLEPVLLLVKDSLKIEKQAIVFCNTRRSSESYAKRVSVLTEGFLSVSEKKELSVAGEKLLGVLESPTEQCRTLALLVKRGVCFHNAGLLPKQREIIEGLFRRNLLKVLTSTTTLGSGINLPAFRVLIPCLFRFSGGGLSPISVREYLQLSGRAGRAKFDSRGESVIFSRSFDDVDFLRDKYVNGVPEPVGSWLDNDSVLRMILLSAVSTNFVFDLASLESFFSKTFFAHKKRNSLDGFFLRLNFVLRELEEMGFVVLKENFFEATAIGRRVSELYLDPLTAHKFISALKKSDVGTDFFYLYLLCDSSEVFPLPHVSRSKEMELWEAFQENKLELPVNVDVEMFSDPGLLQKYGLVQLLDAWINEKPEQFLVKEFNVAPGILFEKLRVVDWLNYSATELCPLIGAKHHLPVLSKLRKRLKSGIKAELVPLCEIRGIGRVRGRKLFNSRFRNIEVLKKASVEELTSLIGYKTALGLKKHFGS